MTYYAGEYEVIVIGAGHAGATALAAPWAADTAVAINLDAVARMLCNPAIGGPRGHVSGRSYGRKNGKNIDKTCIQIRC